MNKIWLIFKREFLNRVQKKSFLIATILIPLIFPAIIAIMFAVALNQGDEAQVIEVWDQSGKMKLESNEKFEFQVVTPVSLDSAKEHFKKSKHYALLVVPPFELSKPDGMTMYSRENPSLRKKGDITGILESRVHDLKLEAYNIDKETLKSLKTNIDLNSVNLKEDGNEQKNDTTYLYFLGILLGVLIYMFVLIYGMQIMMGVIEEKTSKIIEVIVSSVKPFQLMMGKILGIAAVGLLQFAIWVILITVLSSVTIGIFSAKMPQQQAMEQIAKQQGNTEETKAMEQNFITKFNKQIDELPIAKIVFNFAFFFLGGYLLYGALFAAVGSAVDSQQEAQQFTLPLMMPLIIAYLGLFVFVLDDPHSTASFWFSIIPFTSPIAMMGRLAFDVPWWQLLLSQVLLIGGFLFTTWIAGRIYRVGILMSGTKVNYKILAKWFMMRS